jgi:hypothetical protein
MPQFHGMGMPWQWMPHGLYVNWCVPWTMRSLDDASLGQCVPWTMRSLDDVFLGRCVLWTMCSLDDVFFGRCVPWTICSLDNVSLTDVAPPWATYKRYRRCFFRVSPDTLCHRNNCLSGTGKNPTFSPYWTYMERIKTVRPLTSTVHSPIITSAPLPRNKGWIVRGWSSKGRSGTKLIFYR